MRRRITLGFLLFVLLGWSTAQQRDGNNPIETSDHPLATPYGDVRWVKIVPAMGARSPEIALLHIDPVTKATELMIRSTAAVHAPMHWHSANETHTVIRGNVTFEHGGTFERLGPGGFNYIPKKMHHQAWLPANSLLFITVDGAWDVNWVNGAPTAADFGKGAIAPAPGKKK